MSASKGTGFEANRPNERVLVIDDDMGIGDCVELLLQRAAR